MFSHYCPRYCVEIRGQLGAPAALGSEKPRGTHWTGDWMDSRADLDDVKIKILHLTGFEPSPISLLHVFSTCPKCTV
jgi:hypothetical protein